VPAAAVIPAPIAYIKVVAVKKLVVEPWRQLGGTEQSGPSGGAVEERTGNRLAPCYCEEIRVFKAGSRLNTSAWNNKIGLASHLLVWGH
jgi:hypothetical protein